MGSISALFVLVEPGPRSDQPALVFLELGETIDVAIASISSTEARRQHRHQFQWVPRCKRGVVQAENTSINYYGGP